MESEVAATVPASFLLEVEFRGLILLEQLTSGPVPGIHLIIPLDGHHAHKTSMKIDKVDVAIPNSLDLYNSSVATAGNVLNMGKLSAILGSQAEVERTAAGVPVSAVKARIRLPLPQGEIVGDAPFVKLGFKFPSRTHTIPKVGGTGRFSVRIPGSSITVGGQVFPVSGSSMLLKLANMPEGVEVCVPDNHQFSQHHTDAVFPLLKGKPTPPKVTLEGRITPCPMIKGVDPAQCWSPIV